MEELDASPSADTVVEPTAARRRKRLVPRSAVVAALAVLGILAGATGAGWLVAHSRMVAVPAVAGLSAADARAALEAGQLGYVVDASQVSVSVPAGSVISQEPAAGLRVMPGSPVRVVLSVGPQTLAVPDVVGLSVRDARTALEALGLVVRVAEVATSTREPVVLATKPSAGTGANVGDGVLLTVPAEADLDLLAVYDLRGVAVLVDPMPPASTSADPSMEVARRLSALLQAAGASVTSTRTGRGDSEGDRLDVIRSSAADILIGVDVASASDLGLQVVYRTDGAAAARARSLAERIARELSGTGAQTPAMPSADPLVTAFGKAACRVIAGDAGRDVAASPDAAAWADRTARAIYQGLGAALAAE